MRFAAVFLGLALLAGCATPQAQLYARTSRTEWQPSGTPTSDRVCLMTAARLSGRNQVDRDGNWYTIHARCERVK